MWLGELDEAERWLAEAAELALRDEQRVIATTFMAYRSYIADDSGRTHDQTVIAEDALHLSHERGFIEIEGEVYVALGLAREANGMRAEALALIEEGSAAAASLTQVSPR